MIDYEAEGLTGEKMSEDAIVTISAAIAYAAITKRLPDAVTMVDTLAQLVHSHVHATGVRLEEVPITSDIMDDYANAIAVAIYVAECRYQGWIAADGKDDS